VVHQINLASALLTRFDLSGSVPDLDRSTALLETAAGAPVTGERGRLARDVNLASALSTRHYVTGDLRALDDAVAAARRGAGEADGPDRRHALATLAGVLRQRFARRRDVADLEAAIAAARSALSATDPADVERGAVLSTLAHTLADRYERRGDICNLDEAVTHARAAVAAGTSVAGRPALESGLSVILLSHVDATGDTTELVEAAAAARAAVDGTAPDHPDLAMYQSNLANALRAQHTAGGPSSLLDESVTLLEAAIANTPAQHPNTAWLQSNLAAALHHRDGAADRADGMAAWLRAGRSATAPTWVRLRAVAEALEWAWDGADPATAADAGSLAVQLLDELAWHGLTRPDRQEQLAVWNGLAGAAAAAGVATGSAEAAVRSLEQGHAVLWTQVLRQRTPLSRLADQHRDLADRLRVIGGRIDALGGEPSPVLHGIARDRTDHHDGAETIDAPHNAPPDL